MTTGDRNRKAYAAQIEALKIPRGALGDLVQTILESNGAVRFSAPGMSMLPFIRDQDVLTLYPLEGRQPSWGDVVAFIHPQLGTLVVHRLVGRRGALFKIKGDNARSIDLVPQEMILGRVTQVERNGKLIRLGLGAERRWIAWLSALGLLMPLARLAAVFFRLFRAGKQ